MRRCLLPLALALALVPLSACASFEPFYGPVVRSAAWQGAYALVLGVACEASNLCTLDVAHIEEDRGAKLITRREWKVQRHETIGIAANRPASVAIEADMAIGNVARKVKVIDIPEGWEDARAAVLEALIAEAGEDRGESSREPSETRRLVPEREEARGFEIRIGGGK